MEFHSSGNGVVSSEIAQDSVFEKLLRQQFVGHLGGFVWRVLFVRCIATIFSNGLLVVISQGEVFFARHLSFSL